MRCTAIDNTEWLYPDRAGTTYATASQAFHGESPRGTTVGFQVMLEDLDGADADVELENLSGRVFELIPVYVEGTPFLTEENALPHFPERWGPYWIYDCIRPLGDTLHPKNGRAALYVRVEIPADARPGSLNGALRVGGVRVPVTVRVHDARIPADTGLKIINVYNRPSVAKYHHLREGTPEFDRMDTAYLAMLREAHQTMLNTPKAGVRDLGDNRYAFDFSEMEQCLRKATALGYRYFFLGDLGFRKSWKESTILVHGMPAMGYEAYRYIAQYLPALQTFLDGAGLTERCFIGASDEPNAQNATEFRALAGMIRKFAPKLKIAEPVSYGNLHGAADVWIPLNREIQVHHEEFEAYRGDGDELWFYVCCEPRQGGYINRLMDIPLLASRYLFWGCYRYHLTGYLHWAANCFMPGQDPFLQNNPEHHNADSVTWLPSGDTHLVYPGDDGPWMSIRLEAQRESVEDYELFTLLAERNKPLADEIFARCFTAFNDVNYDPNAFRAARAALLAALDET